MFRAVRVRRNDYSRRGIQLDPERIVQRHAAAY
jgi:hypothetical protein